jgi:hypothetical protein
LSKHIFKEKLSVQTVNAQMALTAMSSTFVSLQQALLQMANVVQTVHARQANIAMNSSIVSMELQQALSQMRSALLTVHVLHASNAMSSNSVSHHVLTRFLLGQLAATQTWNALLITTVMNSISASKVHHLKLSRATDARPTLIALLTIIAMNSISVSLEPQDKVISLSVPQAVTVPPTTTVTNSTIAFQGPQEQPQSPTENAQLTAHAQPASTAMNSSIALMESSQPALANILIGIAKMTIHALNATVAVLAICVNSIFQHAINQLPTMNSSNIEESLISTSFQ